MALQERPRASLPKLNDIWLSCRTRDFCAGLAGKPCRVQTRSQDCILSWKGTTVISLVNSMTAFLIRVLCLCQCELLQCSGLEFLDDLCFCHIGSPMSIMMCSFLQKNGVFWLLGISHSSFLIRRLTLQCWRSLSTWHGTTTESAGLTNSNILSV